MDIEDLLGLLEDWLASQPAVRGHGVEDAELRLRSRGGGRLAVWLRPKNPEAELRAVGLFLIEKLEAAKAGDAGEVLETPMPPNYPERAFADFSSLGELEQILRGEKEGKFSFDDEIEQTGDPLKD